MRSYLIGELNGAFYKVACFYQAKRGDIYFISPIIEGENIHHSWHSDGTYHTKIGSKHFGRHKKVLVSSIDTAYPVFTMCGGIFSGVLDSKSQKCDPSQIKHKQVFDIRTTVMMKSPNCFVHLIDPKKLTEFNEQGFTKKMKRDNHLHLLFREFIPWISCLIADGATNDKILHAAKIEP